MGLDFSHTDAHWAHSGFNRFRREIAAYEGIDLDAMKGFERNGETEGTPWDTVTTPLEPLLNHSDCDGVLTPQECRQVAPRLREVVKAIWPDQSSRDRQRALQLADGMDAAAEADEPMEFC